MEEARFAQLTPSLTSRYTYLKLEKSHKDSKVLLPLILGGFLILISYNHSPQILEEIKSLPKGCRLIYRIGIIFFNAQIPFRRAPREELHASGYRKRPNFQYYYRFWLRDELNHTTQQRSLEQSAIVLDDIPVDQGLGTTFPERVLDFIILLNYSYRNVDR
jgi:hypothetical protein